MSFSILFAQDYILPQGFSIEEHNKMSDYLSNISVNGDVITTPPDFSVRTMAEWEEIQALTIAWEGFEPILTEIVRNAVSECTVLIACDNPNSVNIEESIAQSIIDLSIGDEAYSEFLFLLRQNASIDGTFLPNFYQIEYISLHFKN